MTSPVRSHSDRCRLELGAIPEARCGVQKTHKKIFLRQQWAYKCASFGEPRVEARAWRLVGILTGVKVSSRPVAALSIKTKTIPQSCGSPLPKKQGQSLCIPSGTDDDFTICQLPKELRHCKRRSTPCPNEVTYQALPNIDQANHFRLLEMLNEIWKTDILSATWLECDSTSP